MPSYHCLARVVRYVSYWLFVMFLRESHDPGSTQGACRKLFRTIRFKTYDLFHRCTFQHVFDSELIIYEWNFWSSSVVMVWRRAIPLLYSQPDTSVIRPTTFDKVWREGHQIVRTYLPEWNYPGFWDSHGSNYVYLCIQSDNIWKMHCQANDVKSTCNLVGKIDLYTIPNFSRGNLRNSSIDSDYSLVT